MDFKQELVILLSKATSLHSEDIAIMISLPPDQKMGDYAFPCFKLGKNPKEEAEKLKKKIVLPSFISKVDVAGPYLNFYLNKPEIAKNVLETILKSKENYGQQKEKRKILVEYCGPNTNKPLHLGHVRNMALGNAVYNLLQFLGNDVHPVNIINDRGIHICQSMLAYQKWGNNKKPDKKGDHFVGDFYVLFAKALKENPALKEEAQQLLQQWENKDKPTHELWKKMNGWVLNGFAETYKRFGIAFEKEYFESQYYEKGKDIALDGLKKGIFEKDETNAIIAKLDKFKIEDKVVLRGDGTSIYITQDLYLAEQRFQDYRFDKLLYVVASEQQFHFKQLFAILELLGKPYAKSLYHLSYGLVNLPTGRMKSREGTVVDADDILDEMSALAEKEVRSRYPTLSEKEIKRRAEFIGLAAIKFFMLKVDPVKDIVFNPEESLSFEGETGPYIQYTHARACSILRKAPKKGKSNYLALKEPSEQGLILLLSRFPAMVQEVAAQFKIQVVSHYLLTLAQSFNEFYHSCPVISDEKELMNARLALVDATRQVLANGLGLLGIHPPEEM
ncbi:TPA: arginine--tRNA ligase [Candidatus Woesearchaeota archaeon]|nr:arginine--tRNA ligase [Candidatus Woesearchaeota archaeon]